VYLSARSPSELRSVSASHPETLSTMALIWTTANNTSSVTGMITMSRAASTVKVTDKPVPNRLRKRSKSGSNRYAATAAITMRMK